MLVKIQNFGVFGFKTLELKKILNRSFQDLEILKLLISRNCGF